MLLGGGKAALFELGFREFLLRILITMISRIVSAQITDLAELLFVRGRTLPRPCRARLGQTKVKSKRIEFCDLSIDVLFQLVDGCLFDAFGVFDCFAVTVCC